MALLAVDFGLHERFCNAPRVVLTGAGANECTLHEVGQIILADGDRHPISFPMLNQELNQLGCGSVLVARSGTGIISHEISSQS
jgi:hypothetical protein